jgi:phosphate/sulfate permease
VAQQYVWAWVLTIPDSAIIGALTYEVFDLLFETT